MMPELSGPGGSRVIHVSRDGREIGAFAEDEILSPRFLPTDLAWHDTIPEWLPLAKLYPARFAQAEPASAPVPPLPAPIRPRRLGWVLGIALVLLAVIGIVILQMSREREATARQLADQFDWTMFEHRGLRFESPVPLKILEEQDMGFVYVSDFTGEEKSLQLRCIFLEFKATDLNLGGNLPDLEKIKKTMDHITVEDRSRGGLSINVITGEMMRDGKKNDAEAIMVATGNKSVVLTLFYEGGRGELRDAVVEKILSGLSLPR